MPIARSSEGHDIVVVGASAGGVEALRSLVRFLPEDLAATIFVVLHLPPVATSVLPRILTRAGRLEAVHAAGGEPFEPGRIYVSPPDRHMCFAGGAICLDRGPKVNGHRPAVDPMFRSAAETFSGRVTGVILSGVLDDGAAGLYAVADRGGAALVQSTADALYPGMPSAALRVVTDAFVGRTEELAGRIVELTNTAPSAPAAATMAQLAGPSPGVVDFIEVDRETTEAPQPGRTAGLTCPECHGSLWESDEGGVKKYRCRTGHEFTAESLMAAQSEDVERALWAALRALEEKAALYRRMSGRFEGRPATAVRFTRKSEAAVEQAVVLRALLRDIEPAEDLLHERAS